MSDTKVSIEEKIIELEAILTWFESDTVTVADALKKYERAQKLAATLESELMSAKNQVEQIELKYSVASQNE